MDSSVSPKEEIWLLRVCHHVSNAVYPGYAKLRAPHFVDRCTDKVLLNIMCNNYSEWEIWGSHSGVVQDSGLLECVVRRELPDESKNLTAFVLMVTQSNHSHPIRLVSSLHIVFSSYWHDFRPLFFTVTSRSTCITIKTGTLLHSMPHSEV
jgi:hypothetical protein